MVSNAYHRNVVSKPLRIFRAFDGFLFVLIALVALPGVGSKNGRALAAGSAEQPGTYDSAFGFGKQSLGLSGGYGFALPVGGTDAPELEDIQFVYVTPRWGVGISNPLGERSWYRGNFELLLEGTFLYMFEPKSGIAGGLAPMLRYNFLTGGRVIPFLQAGAGVIALDADLSRQSDGLNFILQSGVGLHFFLSQSTALTGEWRFHHISNASIHDKNAGINSSLFMLGVTFFLR
jgi:lipid A 3-O-deacylase